MARNPFFRRSAGRLLAVLRRLCRDRGGNVLVLTALVLMPLIALVGMTLDYASAARLQTKLGAAGDAAALSAVTTPMLSQSIQGACNAARMTFLNSLQQNANGLTVVPATDLKISITETYPAASDVTKLCASGGEIVPTVFTKPSTRVVNITFTGRSSNAFGTILGQASIALGGNATARAGLSGYYQIVFLVDVSGSMSVAGTAADVINLQNEKTIGCGFTCHDPNGTVPVAASNWCDANPGDYFCRAYGATYCPFGAGKCATVYPSKTYSDRSALAQLYGYKLKIDYVRDALNSFMTSLKPIMDANPSKYNVGFYQFGQTFVQSQAFTSSSSAVQNAISKMNVEVATGQNWTYTSFSMQSTLSTLTNIGNGSSPTSRKTYVIFLSDGVEDIPGTSASGHVTNYNYLAQCQALKNANVTLFSIETAYPAITDDPNNDYRDLILTLPGNNNGVKIADAMKSCASTTDRYFQATEGPAIQSAVDSVFTSITGDTARLTK